MNYARQIPEPPLDSFITELYYIEGALPFSQPRVLLWPSLHLVFNLGAPQLLTVGRGRGGLVLGSGASFLGPQNTFFTLDSSRPIRLLGAVFEPWGAYPLLRIPLANLLNRVVPAAAVGHQAIAEILTQLPAEPEPELAFTLLQRFLLDRLAPPLADMDIVKRALAEMARTNGTLPIRELSQRMAVSHNHLVREFRRLVGVSPKEMARSYRMAYVLGQAKELPTTDWTTIAHGAGFYDQSHFNREFTAFTGSSPTRLLRQECPVRVKQPKKASGADIAGLR